MTYAEVLSLEEFRDVQRRTAVRQRLHERFDRWLQRVEDHVKEPKPPLAELTAAVFALRQELTQARPVDRGVAGSQRVPVLPARGRPDRPGAELAPGAHG